MAIRDQAAKSGVDHLVGCVEKPESERGLSMSQQIKVRYIFICVLKIFN